MFFIGRDVALVLTDIEFLFEITIKKGGLDVEFSEFEIVGSGDRQ